MTDSVIIYIVCYKKIWSSNMQEDKKLQINTKDEYWACIEPCFAKAEDGEVFLGGGLYCVSHKR